MTFRANLKNLNLPLCNFLSKGWEVAILGLLAFIQQQHGLSLYLVGLLSTAFIVSQVFISLFTGHIAHAVHGRNVILLSIACSLAAWLVLILYSSLPMLFLAYTLGGLSSGLFEPIGNSLVAKSCVANRATAIGDFAAFGDMGRIAMAAVAVALAGMVGLKPTFLILLGSTVLALILALIFNRRLEDPAATGEAEFVGLGQLLDNRKFCYAALAGIADSFSSASLYIFIPFLLVAKGIPLENTGWYIGIFFAGYFIGRLGLGRLADHHGPANMLMVGEVAMAGLLILLVAAAGPVVLGALIFLLGIFTRGTSPIIRSMVADAIDGRMSFHNAFGNYSFASRGSSALCRPLFGYVAGYSGIGAVFYIAAAVSLVTLYPAAKYKSAPTKLPATKTTGCSDLAIPAHGVTRAVGKSGARSRAA